MGNFLGCSGSNALRVGFVQIHYSAWLARRWDDPAFPISFPWFGTREYWQGQVETLIEQIEAMQEAPQVG